MTYYAKRHYFVSSIDVNADADGHNAVISQINLKNFN